MERPPLVVVRGVRVRPGPQQSLQDGHVGVEREATERPGEVRHDERPAALPQKVHGRFGVVCFDRRIVQRRATKDIDAVEGEAVLVQEPQDFRPPVGRR